MQTVVVTALSGIIVSLIAGLAGYASQRAAAKASTKNAATSSRADLEKEAYERARAFDTETIKRQDEELEELRKHVKDLNAEVKLVTQDNENVHHENRAILEDNAKLRSEIRDLKTRFATIERKYPTDELPIQRIEPRDVKPIPPISWGYPDGQ